MANAWLEKYYGQDRRAISVTAHNAGNNASNIACPKHLVPDRMDNLEMSRR